MQPSPKHLHAPEKLSEYFGALDESSHINNMPYSSASSLCVCCKKLERLLHALFILHPSSFSKLPSSFAYFLCSHPSVQSTLAKRFNCMGSKIQHYLSFLQRGYDSFCIVKIRAASKALEKDSLSNPANTVFWKE